MPRTTPTQPEATKPTKTLTDGVRLGRAIDKLKALFIEEARELADAPQSIRERFAAKRGEVVKDFPEETKEVAINSALALMPKAAKGEATE